MQLAIRQNWEFCSLSLVNVDLFDHSSENRIELELFKTNDSKVEILFSEKAVAYPRPVDIDVLDESELDAHRKTIKRHFEQVRSFKAWEVFYEKLAAMGLEGWELVNMRDIETILESPPEPGPGERLADVMDDRARWPRTVLKTTEALFKRPIVRQASTKKKRK
jgi:hypothetical protein